MWAAAYLVKSAANPTWRRRIANLVRSGKQVNFGGMEVTPDTRMVDLSNHMFYHNGGHLGLGSRSSPGSPFDAYAVTKRVAPEGMKSLHYAAVTPEDRRTQKVYNMAREHLNAFGPPAYADADTHPSASFATRSPMAREQADASLRADYAPIGGPPQTTFSPEYRRAFDLMREAIGLPVSWESRRPKPPLLSGA